MDGIQEAYSQVALVFHVNFGKEVVHKKALEMMIDVFCDPSVKRLQVRRRVHGQKDQFDVLERHLPRVGGALVKNQNNFRILAGDPSVKERQKFFKQGHRHPRLFVCAIEAQQMALALETPRLLKFANYRQLKFLRPVDITALKNRNSLFAFLASLACFAF